jgi:hypothetical protein
MNHLGWMSSQPLVCGGLLSAGEVFFWWRVHVKSEEGFGFSLYSDNDDIFFGGINECRCFCHSENLVTEIERSCPVVTIELARMDDPSGALGLQGFLDWLDKAGVAVVVWDMDCTMSAGHCGSGLPKAKLDEYIAATSPDFVAAVRAIASRVGSPPLRLAVATGSDPAEYDLEGQSRDTHILGPDLASAVISRHCPEVLPLFEIMVGFDCRLHAPVEGTTGEPLNMEGKRHHMRLIQAHFQVPFTRMVLIDDSPSSLVNEDGWLGIKVDGRRGFLFEHCAGTTDTS